MKGRLGGNKGEKERANLRTTAKGAHEGELNGLQIDCGTRKIQGRVKDRNEGHEEKWREVRRESKCVGGGESSNRMREGDKRADMSCTANPKSANQIM